MPSILAGSSDSINSNDGDWAICDIGFAHKRKSCCLWFPTKKQNSAPELMTFDELKMRLRTEVGDKEKIGVPLHLLIEAPLSVAFSKSGNPQGRDFERKDGQTRYWYCGLGCCVTVSAMYLMRELKDTKSGRTIFLYEGFVSFKPKATAKPRRTSVPVKAPSSHETDVRSLWKAINTISMKHPGVKEHVGLASAFKVVQMDFGVPPVIIPGTKGRLPEIYG